uniref:hypothetical protein n=1 Tax=uncultured Caulobacter sp. TaxID=158749 RepID=UPI0025D3F11D
MVKTTTWQRNLGDLLVACVLALLVLIPTVASAACVCDERPASVAGQTIQADQKHDSAPCKAASCLGGHCHHGGSLIDAPAVAVSTPAPKAAEHALAPAPAPA